MDGLGEAVGGGGVGDGALEVEAEGAGGFVLAVDDDDVWEVIAGGADNGCDSGGKLPGGQDGGERLQAYVGGEQEGDCCGGQGDVAGVGFVVAAEEPVGERAGEERDGGEGERVAEGAHGLGVEIEEVAEGEGVVGGVLLEERGEVSVGRGRGGVEGDEACCERCDGAEYKQDDGDALAGGYSGVGDAEGLGFGGLVVEPAGDEQRKRWDGGEDVVFLASGEREEEQRNGGPEADEEQRRFSRRDVGADDELPGRNLARRRGRCRRTRA